MSLVLIALNHHDGLTWAAKHHVPIDKHLVMVTPRTPGAARGYLALAVYATANVRDHPRYNELLAHAAPAVLTAPHPVLTAPHPGFASIDTDELAHGIDPEAFEDHPSEAWSPLASIQWAARRKIALDHAKAAKAHLLNEASW